ncbi:MAG TPA: hypothetical protein VKD69_07645 [Vicinamibacterales bacterium]|nr:hypothetical protein [Vicinamibacterales bacterium]
MFWLPLASLLSISLAQTPGVVDVSTLKVSAPLIVAELDLGSLKGELRQIGWAPDLSQLYVQTADGSAVAPTLHHYLVPASGGSAAAVGEPPPWAQDYWSYKSDRFAPGMGSLFIDVKQSLETLKYGTGSAGLIESADRAGNVSIGAQNVDRAAVSDKQRVVRLQLLGETISEFVNAAPVPGLMFGWGPAGSGAIAFTDRDGRLFLFNRDRHKQAVSGAKHALLPAWSTDGSRLAWVQKTARRTYALVVATVSNGY